MKASMDRKLELFGGRVEEMLLQRDIPRKVICDETGIDLSILAKIINGVRIITLEQIVSIWFAAGCYVTRRSMKTPDGRLLCTA